MSISIAFVAYGEPKGQPRPRACIRNIGGQMRASVFEKGTAESWKACIQAAAAPHRPKSVHVGPVICDVVFVMPRPQSMLKKSSPEGRVPFIKKPDRDNLDKAVLDAFKVAGYWREDCQVYDGRISKYYGAKGEAPKAEISIVLESVGATQ